LDAIAQTPASSEATAAFDCLRFEAVFELAQLLSSYSRSAEEAAWCRDRQMLGVHLKQARAVLIEALKTYREISEEESS
jgi:hypothetical protein